jgi:hypothetical protein
MRVAEKLDGKGLTLRRYVTNKAIPFFFFFFIEDFRTL